MTTLREPLREESASAPLSSVRQQRKFRPELQGLRALAAGLVVVYHVWLGRVSGGVDVFFFVSGFLITGQLFRASVRGRIEFRPFWGRMFKRLFPAALTVIAASMVAALVWLPEHRWLQTAKEIVASALYYENWELAASSADYFAQHNSASIMQHFWSLSIQGQFYLVWPLLIGALMLLVRPFGWSMRATLLTVLSLLFAGSLAYSVWLTEVNQPLAYFHSGTRVWEFALGGLLALTIDRVVLPRWLAVVAGWLGVVGLASCGLVLQVGTMFPGYVALWPMVSALLVLLAGATGSRVGADRFLSSRPLIYLGNISYSLYLWHWPVLLFYLLVRGRSEVGLVGGAGVIGLSLVLSVVTYHFVENPVRDSKIGVTTRWGAYRFAVLVLVPVIAGAVVWQNVSIQRASFEFRADDPRHPGAAAVSTGAPAYDPEKPIIPPYAALPQEWIKWKPGECVERMEQGIEVRTCTVNPLNGAEPAKRLVVVGDSHSMQLMGALRPIQERLNWQLIVLGRPGCPLTATEVLPNNQVCVEWNRIVLPKIVELDPDAVITMATRDVRVGLKEWTPEGYVRQWQELDKAGIPVVAIRDNPRFDFEPSECVQIKGLTSPECGHPRAEMYHAVAPYDAMPGVPANTSFVDLSDYFCTETTCPPVIGNVLVYMDDNHVSNTYMNTLSPFMQEKMLAALGWKDTSAPR
ncbi:acyltransferase family protein [Saccharomonospora xinjiangensis]|uniref:acyltransferase family protein n=1 Tax=Saccharomonospora xinjiangensis TaxID=75294 RepID=UPI00106FA653|nr:acyltransferase family protein [Saccharomonospora xinjiangensis]QBQ60959.1 O-acetyltransferase OatA [Saccharomonospora xinjiangensis]